MHVDHKCFITIFPIKCHLLMTMSEWILFILLHIWNNLFPPKQNKKRNMISEYEFLCCSVQKEEKMLQKESTTYIFINVHLPLIRAAVFLKVLKERGAAIGRRQRREMQIHEEKFIDFGYQRPNKGNQKWIRFCFLFYWSTQDALQLPQEVACFRLALYYFSLKEGV